MDASISQHANSNVSSFLGPYLLLISNLHPPKLRFNELKRFTVATNMADRSLDIHLFVGSHQFSFIVLCFSTHSRLLQLALSMYSLSGFETNSLLRTIFSKKRAFWNFFNSSRQTNHFSCSTCSSLLTCISEICDHIVYTYNNSIYSGNCYYFKIKCWKSLVSGLVFLVWALLNNKMSHSLWIKLLEHPY